MKIYTVETLERLQLFLIGESIYYKTETRNEHNQIKCYEIARESNGVFLFPHDSKTFVWLDASAIVNPLHYQILEPNNEN